MNRRVPQTKYFLLWVHPLRRATLAFKRKADAALTFDKLRYRKSWHWWSGLRLRRKKRFGGCSPWGVRSPELHPPLGGCLHDIPTDSKHRDHWQSWHRRKQMAGGRNWWLQLFPAQRGPTKGPQPPPL